MIACCPTKSAGCGKSSTLSNCKGPTGSTPESYGLFCKISICALRSAIKSNKSCLSPKPLFGNPIADVPLMPVPLMPLMSPILAEVLLGLSKLPSKPCICKSNAAICSSVLGLFFSNVIPNAGSPIRALANVPTAASFS